MSSANISTPCESHAAGTRITDGIVGEVIDILRTRTGVDFASYRLAMLERRIATHYSSVGATSNDEYLHILQSSAAETHRLLERVTIKVSRFYRHAPAFNHLRDGVLARLASARKGEPLRIWSIGCGTGEEPYTFAMLLEQAGIEGTIDATDVDASALTQARAGIYSLAATAELPPELTNQFLEPVVCRGQPHYRVQDNLRLRVRFSRHDILSVTPPPGGEEQFDLISCRNVLIYVQRAAQLNATRRLLDLIRTDGILCLGEAEWPPPELESRLEALAHKTRLFRVREPDAGAA